MSPRRGSSPLAQPPAAAGRHGQAVGKLSETMGRKAMGAKALSGKARLARLLEDDAARLKGRYAKQGA